MKKLALIFFFFSFISCTKQKTVFICGDHICVNKVEAQQYFEENLILEVKVLQNKGPREISLVELNLNNTNQENKQVFVQQKNKTRKKIKVLTGNEKKRYYPKLKKKILIRKLR